MMLQLFQPDDARVRAEYANAAPDGLRQILGGFLRLSSGSAGRSLTLGVFRRRAKIFESVNLTSTLRWTL